MSKEQEEEKPSKDVVLDDGPMLEYIRKLLKEHPEVEEDKKKA
jgi:hypothetical protein